MISYVISKVSQYGALTVLLLALLFIDGIRATHLLFASIAREITTIVCDPAIQWILVLYLACYFIALLILESRLASYAKWHHLGNPDLWLAGLVAFALLRYAFAYQTASSSQQVSVLLTGIIFGKSISAWVRWRKIHIERRAIWIVSLLIFMFVCAVFWQPETAITYQYHDISRWSGIWGDPNLFGLLMGTGSVLTMGIGVRRWQMVAGRWERTFCATLCLMVAILLGYGLFKSYSRGAWFGTFVGSAYWATRAIESSRLSARFRRNRLLILVILISVFVLAFWQFRFSELPPVQRMVSVTNANDFSWRNRVAAWKGSIHMMFDRPLIGFGWGQAESAYETKYCQLDESTAIQMNDFFMLGISAGAPPLLCFIAYLILAYREKSTGRNPPLSIFTTCRSGSIVLLVGFWFDGVFFNFPIGPIFWMLVELSREASLVGGAVPELKSKAENQSETSCVVSHSKFEICLRWVAWTSGMIALLQTTVYLVTPFLPVNKTSLTIARKCLIPPKEIGDFDFLSTNVIWQDRELRILMRHANLAYYNRELINWQLDDKMYQNYVLSPVITGDVGEQLNWRRPLWEEFYPRIRHVTSEDDAAEIVVLHLRECVNIADLSNLSHSVPEIWLRKITDKRGFEIVYVAALRSVGVPARVGQNGQAEFFDGLQWQLAPRPIVESFRDN